MNYSEADLLFIYYAILEDDYNKINDNFKELGKNYDSIKLLINAYQKERREGSSKGVTIDDLSYLINILKALEYIRPLTNDDYDTIKLLLNISYMKTRYDVSFHLFQGLLTLIFCNINSDDIIFTQPVQDAGNWLIDHYDKYDLKSFNLPNKMYELYDMCSTLNNELEKTQPFILRKILFILLLQGCMNNNFNYFKNFVSNPTYYADYLYNNGFIKYIDMFDLVNLKLIYKNIENIFVEPKYIIK